MSRPLRSKRGAIGTQWYAARLRGTLEALLGSGRAASGKRAARAGRVQWVDISGSAVRGDVLDDDGEIYAPRLDVTPFGDGDREAFRELAQAHPELGARLAAGAYPEEREDEFARHEVPLVPSRPDDLTHDCSCLDWPGPCKHVAALGYVLVEEVDARPTLLLGLRGLDPADLVAAPDGAEADGGSSVGGEADSPTTPAAPAAPAFDPHRTSAQPLVEALGEDVGTAIASFYRPGAADA